MLWSSPMALVINDTFNNPHNKTNDENLVNNISINESKCQNKTINLNVSNISIDSTYNTTNNTNNKDNNTNNTNNTTNSTLNDSKNSTKLNNTTTPVKYNNTFIIDKNISDNTNTNNTQMKKNNKNYLNITLDGYKVIIKTNGLPFGHVKSAKLNFVKVNKDEYVISPVVLNTPMEIYAKFESNTILHKTVTLNNTKTEAKEESHYLNISYENCKLIIKTNGKPDAKYENLSVNINFKKVDNNTYLVYPLLLNNTINVCSLFDNETLNKTVFLNYAKPKEKHYLNVSIEGYELRIFTNGELIATSLNKNKNISIKKLDDSEYTIYPLLLNTTIILYSKFDNETLNKTIYLPYIRNITKDYADKKTIVYSEFPFNFYINKGKFKKFDADISNKEISFEIDNISKGGFVNLTVESPIEIPEGMYIYYWKNVSGKLIPINHTILSDRKHIVISLKDGQMDEDGKEDGKIIDPFKFYVPKFNVKTEFKNNNKTGILYISDLKGNELYNITANIDKGKFDYLKFVDEDNVPIKSNANLPYNLIKFRVSNISKGENVNVKITYPEIPFESDDLLIPYYKFNPNKFEWYKIDAKLVNNNAISFTLTDGELGDDDSKIDGAIEDDGGIGWVGFTKPNVATVGVKGTSVYQHWYKTLVPYGKSSFNISIDDMSYITLLVYYPNGTLYANFTNNQDSNGWGNWATFEINTNGQYGWWKIEICGDETVQLVRGDYYGINITNEVLSWNETAVIDNENFTTTPFIYALGLYESNLCGESYYILSNGSFKVAIYDSDNLNITIYYPNGTQYGTFYPTGNRVWDVINVVSDTAGLYKIVVKETDTSFDDYIWVPGVIWTPFYDMNLYRIASNKNIYMCGDEDTIDADVYTYNKTVNVGETFNLTVYAKNTGDFNISNLNISINLPTGLTCYNTSKIINYILPNETEEINFTITANNMGVYLANISLRNDFLNISNTTTITVKSKIEGTIYEDFGVLGVNDLSDKPIPNVNVSLVKDTNGNNKPDVNDLWIYNTTTNTAGNYNFTPDKDGIYFIVVNSMTVNTTMGLNDGYTLNDIWAEETYQTNDSNYSQIMPFFGGRNATINDNWTNNVYEHYIIINTSKYNGKNITFGFSFNVIVNANDPGQGSFRQFINNANAIQGENYMRFVPMNNPNTHDTNGMWWTIKINETIGALPYITDDHTIIDGTAYYPNGTVRDNNPGEAYSETVVGIGSDAIPDSGDEYTITAIKKVELAIDGNDFDTNVIKIYANDSKVLNVSIYGGKFDDWKDDNGAAIQVGGQNITIENTILNAYPNGIFVSNSWIAIDHRDYTNCSGLKIIHNLLSRNHPIHLGYNGESKNILIEENIIWSYWSPSIMFGSLSTKYGYSGVVINHNYLYGGYMPRDIETQGWASIETRSTNVSNLIIENNTIIPYDITDSTAISLGEYTKDVRIRYNLIRDAKGSAIAMSRYRDYNPSAKNIVITKNSIINSGKVAIDFLNDYVTINDGQLNSSQPNYGIDYPVITSAYFNSTHLHMGGFIGNETQGGSSEFANAIVEIYLVKNSTGGDNLIGNNISSDGSILSNHYGEGWAYLGAITADGNGNFNGVLNVSGKGVEDGSLITATATIDGIGTSEFGRNYLISRYYNLLASVWITSQGYNISVKSYNNTQNVYVYWYKPDGVGVINTSGDYNENGTNGNTYRFKFNTINTNETKNITIETNISTMDGLIIGIDP